MKEFLKEYFSFSRSETRSIIAILFLLQISFLCRIAIRNWPYSNTDQIDSLLLEELIDLIITREETKDPEENFDRKHYATTEYSDNYHVTESLQQFNLKPFNPNTAYREELISIGLRPAVVMNLLKYRNAGGRFKRPEDLRKIYGMNDSVFRLIKDYIIIEADISVNTAFLASERPETLRPISKNLPEIIELNSADSFELKQLKGIGPVFAARIIKYRDLLGGFYSHEQLKEVYGMDSSRFRLLLKQTKIDTQLIRKINLNSGEIHFLNSHPYINTYHFRSLLYYLKSSGEINELEELRENKVLPSEIYEKCRWYFTSGSTQESGEQ